MILSVLISSPVRERVLGSGEWNSLLVLPPDGGDYVGIVHHSTHFSKTEIIKADSIFLHCYAVSSTIENTGLLKW